MILSKIPTIKRQKQETFSNLNVFQSTPTNTVNIPQGPHLAEKLQILNKTLFHAQ